MKYSKKAINIAPSLTLEIAARAKEMKAEGLDIINLSVGEPDFETPAYIAQAAIAAVEEGKTKYTPVSGIEPLREAIAEKYRRKKIKASKDEVVVSTGAKQSLFNAIMAIINPGDEVLIPLPYWLSYPEMVHLSGGKAIFVPPNQEGKVSPEILSKYLSEKTKALIINNPNNPSGVVYQRQELEDLADFCLKEDLFIIADEIYERLNYGVDTCSLAELSEEVKNRTITISGFSKSYAMTGWRLGYSLANPELTALMTKIQAHTTSNPTTVSQYAGLAALTEEDASVEVMVKEFKNRRDYFVGELKRLAFSMYEAEGAFYIFFCIDQYLGKEIKGYRINGSLDFCHLLLDRFQIAAVPGLAFGQDNFVRFSYASSQKDLESAVERLEELVKEVFDE